MTTDSVENEPDILGRLNAAGLSAVPRVSVCAWRFRGTALLSGSLRATQKSLRNYRETIDTVAVRWQYFFCQASTRQGRENHEPRRDCRRTQGRFLPVMVQWLRSGSQRRWFHCANRLRLQRTQRASIRQPTSVLRKFQKTIDMVPLPWQDFSCKGSHH